MQYGIDQEKLSRLVGALLNQYIWRNWKIHTYTIECLLAPPWICCNEESFVHVSSYSCESSMWTRH